MATEIFIEPELDELQDVEKSTEWTLIAEELGLVKQTDLSQKSEENKPPPYMFIDPKTERIIRTLCPCKSDVREYSASTIPLDILQELHKCKENGWYTSISIFYDNKSPDPFVVGYIGSSWNATKHLIARWGNELLPFEILEQKAVARLKNGTLSALYEMKSKIDFAYANAEGFIESMLAGTEAPKVQIQILNLDSWSDTPF